MIKLTNSFTARIKKKKPHGTDRGFSLAELLVVVAIMVVLVGVTAPILISHIHRARVAKDWANLRSYYMEAQADFISTGEINPVIYKDIDVNENWERRELEYLDGTKVKLLAGYFAVTLDDAGEFGQQALSTIICEGDAIGAVILYEKDEKSRMTETESKLAIAAAGFLGKQMEQ